MKDLPTHVLGIDPGLATGMFLYNTETGEHETTEVDFPEYGFWLEDAVAKHRPALAVEAFDIGPKTHQAKEDAHYSIEGIGVARYLSWKYGVTFIKQGRSSAKNFGTNDRLKALGWYAKGMGHGVDAQRQALLYLIGRGWWSDKL